MIPSKPSVICFGEMLWDLFPSGKKPGGAPFNVAAHLAILGINSTIISAVGTDENGNILIDLAEKLNINASLIQKIPHKPTGIVSIQKDHSGDSHYEISSLAAWDFIQSNDEVIARIKAADVLVYGSLVTRKELSRATLDALIKHASFKIMDINLRPPFDDLNLLSPFIRKADVLKLNLEELFQIHEYFISRKRDTIEKMAHAVMDHFEIDQLLLTKGGDGAEFYYNKQRVITQTKPTKVIDTTGCGDGFLASFIYHFLSKVPIEKCLESAVRYGEYVASYEGAIPHQD